jgi:RNA polymerase II-associated protein 1
MAFRGQRFELNLDPEDDSIIQQSSAPTQPFVKDVLENEADDPIPPSLPKPKSSTTGFPEHQKRARPSRFKQMSARKTVSTNTQSTTQQTAPRVVNREEFDQAERRRIDEENKQRLENMSVEEIEQAKKELLSNLSGSLIEKLLRRSNIEEEVEDIDKPLRATSKSNPENTSGSKSIEKTQKKVTFGNIPQDQSDKLDSVSDEAKTQSDISTKNEGFSNTNQPPDLPKMHFPRVPVPELDPNSSTFLTDLHEKYFPTLEADPSKLAWMAPLSDKPSQDYDPESASLPPASLRFDFQGNLLPPRLSHQLPTNLGLHHHGIAPEAAGYAIPELAILARSTVPAQRCMAFQTLGRILYKLGTGVFGDDGGEKAELDEEDGGAVLCRGLWSCIAHEKALDILIAEASKPEGVGHRSAHALAVEAVWLWRRGGGRQPKKLEQPDQY